MRILLTISYDGTNYCGWQSQKNGLSVQQVIEEALFALCKENISLFSSGRTDAGVHAQGQVAHFDTKSAIPPQKFAPAINTLLPPDIRILSSKKVKDDFHARYTAKQKTYVYNFYISPIPLPLKERYSMRIDGLDINLCKKALSLIEGTHDFKCFSSTGSTVKSTVRTIYSATLKKTGNNVVLKITGNGFLYNMVRIIAGTLICLCQGKITLNDIETAFCTGDRNLVGKTAPAKGLVLEKVKY